MTTPLLLPAETAPTKYVLREDQEEAVDRIVDELAFADRTQAIMACGTGKTLMAQRASERIVAGNPDSVILVAVPNLVLVDQMLGEWSRQVAPGFSFVALPVNSGARGSAPEEGALDDDEVTDVAMEGVTSDPTVIASFMTDPGRKVIFSTYQSMGHIARALKIVRVFRPGFKVDLIVADEAHRTAGTQRSKGMTSFKLVLDDTKVPASKRLFLTATPRISRLKSTETDTAAASMGNAAVYGDRAITRSLRWAISKKLLAPYRTYVIQVSDADVEEVIARNKDLLVDGTDAEARQIAAAISLAKSAAQNGLGGVVTYHSRIAGAKEFKRILYGVVKALPEGQKPAGKLTINHINGTTPAEERERILATLDSSSRASGDWSVVTNCNCLTEGVNVPSMDAIMFVDPRKSVVNNVQAIGRPLRLDRNNPDKIASIVLPVFVREDQSVAEALEGGAFEGVYEVIKSLRDVDDVLSEIFIESLLRQTGCSSAGTDETPGQSAELAVAPAYAGPLLALTDSAGRLLPGQPEDALIRVAAPASAGTALVVDSPVTARDHWSEWHAALQVRLVEDSADFWERGIAALTVFTAREGHSRVAAGHVENGHPLGVWVSSRRAEYKAGKLAGDRIIRLENFAGWSWNALTGKWAAQYQLLVQFVDREGHSRVTLRQIEDGFALGSWVARQRHAYSSGKLTAEQICLLQHLPGWAWDPARDAWVEVITALRSFREREGHLRIPFGHVENGLKLTPLVANRRTAYSKGAFSAEQILELESVPGWVWDVASSNWAAGIAAVTAFVAREGHARIPNNHKEGQHRTGGWAATRRTEYKEGRLNTEQVQELEAFPGWRWDMLADRWDEGVAAVMAFALREGHALVPRHHFEAGHPTGGWVANKRNDYKEGVLTAEQIRSLEEVPGWVWDVHAFKWQGGMEALRSFAAREGHTDVPRGHEENGYKLGDWIKTRNLQLRSGQLTPERIRNLDSAGAGWRKGHLAPWESAPGVDLTPEAA
jgi:superfamily II DNA or RNA helicase/predicted transglutaminase-like cysteine proteinase